MDAREEPSGLSNGNMPVSATYVTRSPAMVTVFVTRTGACAASGIFTAAETFAAAGALVAAVSAAWAASTRTNSTAVKFFFIGGKGSSLG